MLAERYDINKDLPQQIFPVSYKLLAKEQSLDKQLHRLHTSEASKYELKSFRGSESLLCRNGKICVPQSLQHHMIEWYHTMLLHPGINRTEQTIYQHFTWPTLRKDVTKFVSTCDRCQRYKKQKKKYGYLPPKSAETQPWEILCVDLVGPYKIARPGKKKDLVLNACTMIDPATGWFEISEIKNKHSDTISNIVECQWFCRYPWPAKVIFDCESEFTGKEFQELVTNEYHLEKKTNIS